ncbi:MAG: RpiB/LacA/LacB family sugar-phosphate isomerase [Spirochaetia bacterium]
MKRVVLANDHGGVAIRHEVLLALQHLGYEVNDLGISEDTSVDYPNMAYLATQEYLKGGYEFGVLVCGTGIGISIAANKVRGIRCALVHDCFTAQMAKAHNNVQFIALGGRVKYTDSIEAIIAAFVQTEFAAAHHDVRLAKMDSLEQTGSC